MKLYYDQQVDALYIRLDDSNIIESEEVKEGIEILIVSKRISLSDLKKLQFELA